MTEGIQTDITRLLGIKHPIFLAGMNQAAGPKLAAAVSNAGGIGVLGGVNYTPELLKSKIDAMKKELVNPQAAFGVDLLLPQVGGDARKTNYDYTKGTLPQLLDVIIESGAKLFVSAVGVPPKYAVDRLHQANILVMNMIGAPKHVPKALEAGVDIICAQGGEGGGHTGDVPTSILIPSVCDMVRGHTSPLTGGPIYVVAAGGIFDGRGLAMALSLGAQAAWVGTRFVASVEAGATKRHKKAVLATGFHDTYRSLIYTGRPMRIAKNAYATDWDEYRKAELKENLAKGVIPYQADFENPMEAKDFHAALKRMGLEGKSPEEIQRTMFKVAMPLLMGQCAANCTEIKPAKVIVDEMVAEAVRILRHGNTLISRL